MHFITGYVFEVEQEGDEQHNVFEVTELGVDVGPITSTTSTASKTLIAEDEVDRDVYAYADEPIASPEWLKSVRKKLKDKKTKEKS